MFLLKVVIVEFADAVQVVETRVTVGFGVAEIWYL